MDEGVPAAAEAQTPAPASATTHTRNSTAEDGHGQSELTGALRGQISDLITQVSQLNGKLVQSYDRISDLEDSLHLSSSQLRQSSVKIHDMELEREQHRAMVEDGLLVEKAHVTHELTRLMVEASESRQKGEEEGRQRQRMEKELDELSAGLFEQANTMVRDARLATASESRKREDAEQALTRAEEAVRGMQGRMGELAKELELVQKNPLALSPAASAPIVNERRLLSTSQPYTEFLMFVAHLRSVHAANHPAPAMSTLIVLPWLARMGVEDVDPTLRLDLAPALNWLSRRSVLTAVQNGNLTIEPVPATNFLPLSQQQQQHSPHCAICGSPIFPGLASSNAELVPRQGGASRDRQTGATWSVNKLKKSLSAYTGNEQPSAIASTSSRQSVMSNKTASSSIYSSPPPTPPRIKTPPPGSSSASTVSGTASTNGASALQVPSQVYIFRIAPTVLVPSPQRHDSPSSQPHTYASFSGPYGLALPAYPSNHSSPASTPGLSGTPSSSNAYTSVQSIGANQSYPLCPSGTCLSRLRTTCTFFAFVRNEVVGGVWREEVPSPSFTSFAQPPPPSQQHQEAPHVQRTTSSGVLNNLNGVLNGVASGSSRTGTPTPAGATGPPPPIPPRKRGLWGSVTSAWNNVTTASGTNSAANSAPTSPTGKGLPAPPPQHPSQHPSPTPTPTPPAPSSGTTKPPPMHPSHLPQSSSPAPPVPQRRNVPPPPPPALNTSSSFHGKTDSEDVLSPPPLPRRAERRRMEKEASVSEALDAEAEEREREEGGAEQKKDDEVLFDTSDHGHDEEVKAEGGEEAVSVKEETAPETSASGVEKKDDVEAAPAPAPEPEAAAQTETQKEQDTPPTDKTPTDDAPVPTESEPQPESVTESPVTPSAPPPIPRRAARRAAPNPPSSSRPGTPVVETPTEPPAEKEEKEEGVEVKEEEPAAAEQESAKQENGNAPSAEPNVSDSETVPTSNPAAESATEPEGVSAEEKKVAEAEAETDDFADAPQSPDVEVKPASSEVEEVKDGEKGEIKEEKTPVVDTVPIPVSDAPQTSSPAGESFPDAPADEDKTPPPPPPPEVSLPSESTKPSGADATGEREKDDAATAAAALEDSGLYISARTWEERTWKELTRLREEMFWARAGGAVVV